MTSALDVLLVVGLVIAGPIVFVGFWMGIGYLLALLGGWTRLAARYRTSEPSPLGAESASGMLGLVSYNGVLVVGLAEDGLDLRTMLLFRAGHPPLRIPWAEIQVEGESRGLLGRVTRLRLGHGPLLRLPTKVWERSEGVR